MGFLTQLLQNLYSRSTAIVTMQAGPPGRRQECCKCIL